MLGQIKTQLERIEAAELNFNRIILLAGLAGLVIILMRIGPQVRTTDDSLRYLEAAQSLIDGKGLVAPDGEPFTLWPPLYPAVLAGVKVVCAWLSIDIYTGVAIFNLVMFALTLFFGARLLQRCIQSNTFVILGIFALALGHTFVVNYRYVWSEPLFILCITLFLLYLPRFLDTKSPYVFAAITVITALTCMQRYPGAVLLLAGGFSILFLMRDTPWLQRLLYAGLYGALSILPLLLWLVRNYQLTGTFFGDRGTLARTMVENIALMFYNAANWFIPVDVIDRVSPPLAVFTSVVFVLSVIFLAAPAAFAHFRRAENVSTTLGVFTLAYIGFVLFSALLGNVGTFDLEFARLLTPIYLPIIGLFLIVAENFCARFQILPSYAILITGLIIWILPLVVRNIIAVLV